MRKHIIWIVILVSLIYAGALFGNFVYDDFLVIVDNDFVKSLSNLNLLFKPRYLTSAMEASFRSAASNIGAGEGSYRPVATLSYFLNYAVFGLNPFGYRLTNLFIHVLCAGLIYVMLELLFAKPRLSLFSAVIFGIHPVTAEVVNCTAFRPNSLALLFSISSLILYFKFKEQRIRSYLAASLFSFLLAVFSKEITVVLPFALLLCDYYRLDFDWRELKKNYRIYSLYFLVDLIYILVYFLFLPPKQQIIGFAGIPAGLARMFDTFGIYLKDMILPQSLVPLDYMLDNPSYLRIILGIIFLAGSVYLILKRKKISRELSFAIIWFLLWVLPMNNFINSFRIPAAHRYLYPALVGFAVFIGFLFTKIWEAKTRISFLEKLMPLAYLGYFSIFTITTNSSWRNDIILRLAVVKKNPENLVAHLGLGNVLLKNGYRQPAKKEFDFILSRQDLNKYDRLYVSSAYGNLGLIYLYERKYQEAAQMYEQAIKLTPQVAYLKTQVGLCYGEQGLYDKALNAFSQAKKIDPGFCLAYFNAGITYMLLHQDTQAKLEFEQTLKICPNYQPARDNLNKLMTGKKGEPS